MANIVYDSLVQSLSGLKRRGPNSWSNFNAICCIHNGETRPDNRNRGGLMLTSDETCVYHCFNCKYKASWKPGAQLSRRMENLLEWTFMPLEDLKRLKFKVWQHWASAREGIKYEDTRVINTNFSFKEVPLPEGAKPFSYWLKPENFVAEFTDVAAYVLDRGEEIFSDYEYYWSPSKEFSINKRVIIPFKWDNKIVGYTARDITGTLKNRYYGTVQPNFIFNTESIDYDNEYIFVTEGPFDAIAINGVAMLGDKITPEQAEWLNQTGKKIVIVPDREKMGGKLVDTAIQQGWYVSFPRWGDDITWVKDPAEAVKKLGKIYTMLSIIDVMFKDALTINVRRRLTLRVR